MTATEWKRCSPGEWEGAREEIVAHITERLYRGESIFITSISTPWISPATILLDNRQTLEGAMDGFEDWIDSTTTHTGG